MLDGIVMSPPFSVPGSQPVGQCPSRPVRSRLRERQLDKSSGEEYGQTPGQIGALSGPCPFGDATMTDVPVVEWTACYEGGWGNLIPKEAYAHPAKMSRALLERILDFGLAEGFWAPGSILGDPFGGIGSTGLLAAYRGIRCISVELEPRFVELANANCTAHRRELEILGCPLPVLVQGDSRRFAAIVGETAGVVTSPPFLATEGGCKPVGGTIDEKLCGRHNATQNDRYGTTEGQIGSLPPGTVDAVVSSPPYAESVKGDHGEVETAQESRDKRKTPGGSLGQSARHGGYGVTEGQIGALREGSVEGVVTSPPYEDEKMTPQTKRYALLPQGCGGLATATGNATDYGSSEGQIGKDSGQTYWQAMRTVYEQVRLALKPGGVAAIVVKDYVSKKKRVPLCDQTCQLLDSLGLKVFLRVHAMLVKEDRAPDLFGGESVKTTERKSFFRRLAEKKGSPRIDFEEVLFCRKT